MAEANYPAVVTRPWRKVNYLLLFVGCPMCGPHPMSGAEIPRVVAYRETTVRFECVTCGLRFSVDKEQLVERLDRILDAMRQIPEGRAVRRKRQAIPSGPPEAYPRGAKQSPERGER